MTAARRVSTDDHRLRCRSSGRARISLERSLPVRVCVSSVKQLRMQITNQMGSGILRLHVCSAAPCWDSSVHPCLQYRDVLSGTPSHRACQTRHEVSQQN